MSSLYLFSAILGNARGVKPPGPLRVHDGVPYMGMPVGSGHDWKYDNGHWSETKISPDLWTFRFDCVKNRLRQAQFGSGPKPGTKYHWLVVGDQVVRKLGTDSYDTTLKGAKLKVGHKRPAWTRFSHQYDDQPGYNDKVAGFLEGLADRIRSQGKDQGFNVRRAFDEQPPPRKLP